jgi:hypothetical protein
MKGKPTFDRGIETVSEFGALTHHDEIWLVDRRDYITECGALTSYGEIWLVESQDRTTALVIADSKEVAGVRLARLPSRPATSANPHKTLAFPRKSLGA